MILQVGMNGTWYQTDGAPPKLAAMCLLLGDVFMDSRDPWDANHHGKTKPNLLGEYAGGTLEPCIEFMGQI